MTSCLGKKLRALRWQGAHAGSEVYLPLDFQR